MKTYKITSTIPMKTELIETYYIKAESKEDAEYKFINDIDGHFIDSKYINIREDVTDYKSLEIEEVNEKI